VCDECIIGFGLFNNECIECKNENQFWNHCADCDINPSSKWPINCKACQFGKDLIKNTYASVPQKICEYSPWISNCFEMENTIRACKTCMNTYYSKGNECLDCDITNCK